MGQALRRLAALAALVLLAACAARDPQSTTNAVTRAVYNDDAASAVGYFDDPTRGTVTRAGVGLLSDKMHALGRYDGLKLLATDARTREYTYRASFAKGTMNVVVRLDDAGKLVAYRVFPT
ncbi:MAG TPA: hypothetical protein VMA98_03360 [Candidatus Acidoferrales bacterium]|nr:hypothetical protein [Candidatus Acidoferrales bacterium]